MPTFVRLLLAAGLAAAAVAVNVRAAQDSGFDSPRPATPPVAPVADTR